MLFDNCIKLRCNLREIIIQIKRPDADLIAAHLVAVVRLDRFVCCHIKAHAGNLMGLVSELRILVLDVGKDLIQITGMERVDIVPRNNVINVNCTGKQIGYPE